MRNPNEALLAKIAISGTTWTATGSVASAAFQFVQVTVVAWVLRPSDLGLMAMVMVVLNFTQLYTDLGINNAIIQRQDTTSNQLSSLYWLNIFAGFLGFVAVAYMTPLAVAFFREPRLYPLLPISATILIIGAFGAQFQVLLRKHFHFKAMAIIDIVKAAVTTVITIGAASLGLGVFSLVVGAIAGSFVSSSLLITAGWQKWRPTVHFALHDLENYLSFGLFQMGEFTLNFIYARIDQLMIGSMLGAEALGYYSLAINLAFLPWFRINAIFTRVAFPIFSTFQQHDNERLKHAYINLIRKVTFISAPLLFGCAATAPLLVPVLYGAHWTPVIPLLQILCGVGLLGAIGNPIGTLILSRGRADIGFWWALITVPLQVSGVYLGLRFDGVVGVAWAFLALQLTYVAAEYFFIIRKILGPCLLPYIDSTLTSTAIAAIMASTVWWIPAIVSVDPIVALVMQIVVGVVAYAVLVFLFQKTWLLSLKAGSGGS